MKDQRRQNSFHGWAFHVTFPKGRASGELHVSRAGVGFECDRGGVELPLRGLRVELGGAGKRLVFFSHSSYPEWSVYTSDRTVLKHPVLGGIGPVRDQVRRLRRRRLFFVLTPVAVLAALAAIIAVLCLLKEPIVAAAARKLSAEWEKKLGTTAFRQYSGARRKLDDAELTAYMNVIKERLQSGVSDNRHAFEVFVFEDDAVNAFALPGGFIVINSGLLLSAGSAEEVAGVLAHEIAHVTEQHGIRQGINAAGLYLAVEAVLGDATGILAVLSKYGPALLTLKYSRKYERAADEKAFAYLTAARIDPHGLLSFFERLQEEQGRLPHGVSDAAELLSTHPPTDERIRRLRELLRTAPEKGAEPFNLQYSELKDTVRLLTAEKGPDSAAENDEQKRDELP